MGEESEDRVEALAYLRDLARDDPAGARHRRTWLGLVLLLTVAATVLILIGAARFLDQAQREHDRVACIQSGVRDQAQGSAAMASAVLDARLTVDQRRAAVASWSRDQSTIATRIGRC